MRARFWMIGCLIGLAGMGSAMASDFDASDITAGNHAAVENSAHDAGSAGGDALGFNRDEPAPKHASETESSGSVNRSSSTAGGSEHGGGIDAPAHARPATLGWQSLLPGSIQ